MLFLNMVCPGPPGGLSGIVPINEVSVGYTLLLKKWAEVASADGDEILTLEKMFDAGMTLRVKILDVDQEGQSNNCIKFVCIKQNTAMLIEISFFQLKFCD
jgi:hypothetical protein